MWVEVRKVISKKIKNSIGSVLSYGHLEYFFKIYHEYGKIAFPDKTIQILENNYCFKLNYNHNNKLNRLNSIIFYVMFIWNAK